MHILLIGGSGFIGRRVADLLTKQGHVLTLPSHATLDLCALNQTAVMPLLEGQDVVINTIGVMSRHAALLETIHHTAPATLAEWAKACGVRRWVQLSALGADEHQRIAFVGSKGRGDAAVLNSGLEAAVARPSVVFGRGGASCELFIKLARLPFLALPNGGRFALQPVHVNDVAAGLAALATQPAEQVNQCIVNMVGAQPSSLAEYFQAMREGIHHKPPMHIIGFPVAWLRPILPLSNIISNGILSADSLALLALGSCADTAGFATLLGRAPLAMADFIQLP